MDTVSTLRSRISGQVVLEGDEGWDAARAAWNLVADQRSALVALPASPADVIEIVGFARGQGLTVAAQGTGHGAVPLGPLAGSVLVKTPKMRGLTIDPAARRARVEAGVLWSEVTTAASDHGFMGLCGSSPDVGVVGYTLGGGLSLLGRSYGSAAASVLAIELVTADGKLRRVDAERDPDLFWALRGGGGNFGVVTAMEFALYPVRELYFGALFWPVERATEVLTAWGDWISDLPDEMSSLGRILHLPPLPELPEVLRGRSFVVVEVVYNGSEEDGAELLRPLRALRPDIDTVTMMPANRLGELHMDPPTPVPAAGDGTLLREFTAETARALDGVVGAGTASPLLSIEVRQLGGAFAAQTAERCACTLADARFAVYEVGMVMSPEMGAAVERGLGDVKSALAPWGAGRGTPNFAEGPSTSSSLFPPEVYERLQAVRARYDPTGLFRASHPIPVGAR
jgi:hypothetical protein